MNDLTKLSDQELLSMLSNEELQAMYNDPNDTTGMTSQERYDRIVAEDKPLENVNPLTMASQANDIASAGYQGIGVGLANLASGRTEQALPRAADATRDSLVNPTLPEKAGMFAGDIASPKSVLIGATAGKVVRPIAKGIKALFGGTKAAGKAIQVAEEAAGLKLNPVNRITPAKEFGFLTKLQEVNPKQLGTQALKDTLATLKDIIETPTVSPNRAIASTIRKTLVEELNSRVAGRAEAAANFATAAKVEKLKEPLKKAAWTGLKTAGKGAAQVLGGLGAWEGTKRLLR